MSRAWHIALFGSALALTACRIDSIQIGDMPINSDGPSGAAGNAGGGPFPTEPPAGAGGGFEPAGAGGYGGSFEPAGAGGFGGSFEPAGSGGYGGSFEPAGAGGFGGSFE